MMISGNLIFFALAYISAAYAFRALPKPQFTTSQFTSLLGLQEVNLKRKGDSSGPFGSGLNPTTSTSLFSARCDEYAARLDGPRWGGPLGAVVRYINISLCGLLFSFILRVLNRFKSHSREILINQIWNRPKARGLLTVSNHMSVVDDPGIWAALLPWWRMRPERMRWSLCTDDVFFALKGRMSACFGAGNVMPLDRTGSLEQPLFQKFQQKLAGGSWCHIFAEGRVWQSWRFEPEEEHLGPFKFGVGKLIAHCKDSPVVVPIYHKGFDLIIPEKQLKGKARKKKPSFPITVKPCTGKTVEVFIGEPLDFSDRIAKFNTEHPGMLDKWQSTPEGLALYMDISETIRKAVLKQEERAWGRPLKPQSVSES